MMSGRGLGHTGGTLDKLESIKNFNVRTPVKDIYKQIKALNVCMFGQTADLAPADKKLYSLRDASGSVESRPLITASILSKKYAEGVDSLIMDVKFGSGAFMKNYKDSKALAEILVRTAKLMGLNCRAMLSDMTNPLGRAVGNANEMLQSILILKGDKKLAPDFYELLMETAVQMLVISGKEKNAKKARAMFESFIENGQAAEKFKEVIKWQGGNPDTVDHPEKYLKNAPFEFDYKAEKNGFVGCIDAQLTGQAAVLLGAGRNKMEDSVDFGAGLWLEKKYGDTVKKGDIIARIYASDKKRLQEGSALFASGVKIQASKPKTKPIVSEIIK
jgi:pyrimidine-nucleoside phosphorylase